VLNGLGQRGWIEQVRSAEGSNRRVWKLTRTGAALVARLQPLWRERESRLQSDLTPQEHELLLQLLERLFQASERLRAEDAKSLPRANRKSAQPRAFLGS
jgi:DNA-binding MarR family transcriptional regulator